MVVELQIFPERKANAVCHVRPHGQNTADTIPLPVKDKLTGADRYEAMLLV